jgi:hypothetical protein
MTDCKSCHHLPSGRFTGEGLQCYCKCHDAADHTPALIEALTHLLNWRGTGTPQEDQAVDRAEQLLARLKGS